VLCVGGVRVRAAAAAAAAAAADDDDDDDDDRRCARRCFTPADARIFLAALREALSRLLSADLSLIAHTPT
jgi:hypothetical protein